MFGDLVEKLVYFKYGIVVILGFIGVKLFFYVLYENEVLFINGGKYVEWVFEILIIVLLGFIVVVMVVVVFVSVIKL